VECHRLAALRADKKASSSGGFSFFSSSSAKFEEAHDLYQQAGNAYKMENRHKEAGDAFSRAAEMALKNDEKDDAANDFWTASKSYKKSHPEREFPDLSKSIAGIVLKRILPRPPSRRRRAAKDDSAVQGKGSVPAGGGPAQGDRCHLAAGGRRLGGGTRVVPGCGRHLHAGGCVGVSLPPARFAGTS
jgi:hypothetical protein